MDKTRKITTAFCISLRILNPILQDRYSDIFPEPSRDFSPKPSKNLKLTGDYYDSITLPDR